MKKMNKVYFKIRRQDNPQSNSYWEEFEVPFSDGMTVITVLRAIQKDPRNVKGETVAPVVWESNCLTEFCGACTMVVNGRARMACSVRVESLSQPVVLEPLGKFPVRRDLIVDQTRMMGEFSKVQKEVSFDGTHRMRKHSCPSHVDYQLAQMLSQCIGCGACLEACPEYNSRSTFIGAAAISAVHFVLETSRKKLDSDKSLNLLMESGSISECGHSQNCQQACPKDIPLITSIAKMEREVVKHLLGRIFGK